MWIYNGKELTDDEIPKKAIGFIYLITQISTGKKYIGRKILLSATTKMVDGKKKKTKKDSGWKDYWSSSPTLKEYFEEHGTDDFTREILSFCSSKGQMVYAEELSLYMCGALESDDWFNNNIRSKVYRNWVKSEESIQLRNAIKHLLPADQ